MVVYFQKRPIDWGSKKLDHQKSQKTCNSLYSLLCFCPVAMPSWILLFGIMRIMYTLAIYVSCIYGKNP